MLFLLVADIPRRASHEDRVAIAVLRHIAAVELGKSFQIGIAAVDPACRIIRRGLKEGIDLIFGLKP